MLSWKGGSEETVHATCLSGSLSTQSPQGLVAVAAWHVSGHTWHLPGLLPFVVSAALKLQDCHCALMRYCVSPRGSVKPGARAPKGPLSQLCPLRAPAQGRGCSSSLLPRVCGGMNEHGRDLGDRTQPSLAHFWVPVFSKMSLTQCTFCRAL